MMPPPRYCSLGETPRLQAGLSAQSPLGEQRRVQFTEIRYAATRLTDFRVGS